MISPEPPAETVLTFPCSGDVETWHLVQAQVDAWQAIYDTVNVVQELRDVHALMIAKPKDRKPAEKLYSFLEKRLKNIAKKLARIP